MKYIQEECEFGIANGGMCDPCHRCKEFCMDARASAISEICKYSYDCGYWDGVREGVVSNCCPCENCEDNPYNMEE